MSNVLVGNTVVKFVNDVCSPQMLLGNASAEKVLRQFCDEVFTDFCLLSQTFGAYKTRSINIWYKAYCNWMTSISDTAVSRTVFTREIRKNFGFISRPCGQRAISHGKHTVQYRVFFKGEEKLEENVSKEISLGEKQQSIICFGNKDFMNYDARKRTLEDFFNFADGRSVSIGESVANIFVERAKSNKISESLRVYDWVHEYARGGVGWIKRKLPKGKYLVELSAPATGLPIPYCGGEDLSDKSYIRLSLLLRDATDEHPQIDSWDEEISEGCIFGRHCLLSFGVTLIEPNGDYMQEFYIDNPGLFEMSPTGFSFDSDTVLAILGNQSEIVSAIDAMRNNVVTCFGNEIGHNSNLVWLDGEPNTLSAAAFDYNTIYYRGFMSPCGMAYGRFGNVISLSCIGSDGYYRRLMDKSNNEDYEGYIIGDEFSGVTGDRLSGYEYDTANPVSGLILRQKSIPLGFGTMPSPILNVI